MEAEFKKTMEVFDEFVKKTKKDPYIAEQQMYEKMIRKTWSARAGLAVPGRPSLKCR